MYSLPFASLNVNSCLLLQACKRAADDFRTKAKSVEPLMTIVEDGDYHFEPNFSASQVRSHRERHARGTAARHIDAVFWRKGST